jgi:hypothetical protein
VNSDVSRIFHESVHGEELRDTPGSSALPVFEDLEIMSAMSGGKPLKVNLQVQNVVDYKHQNKPSTPLCVFSPGVVCILSLSTTQPSRYYWPHWLRHSRPLLATQDTPNPTGYTGYSKPY